MAENKKRRAKRQKKYNARPEQKKRRASRNKARRKAIKKHGKGKMKGKDVHHKDGNPMNNASGNIVVIPASKNRGIGNNK